MPKNLSRYDQNINHYGVTIDILPGGHCRSVLFPDVEYQLTGALERRKAAGIPAQMTKRPLTRVEEVRRARRLRKAELARRAGMSPQTLQRIEDGSTKSLSLSARRLLAPALQVREDQLLMPIGFPIPPLEGGERPLTENETQAAILDELKELRLEVAELLRKILAVLESTAEP